MRRIDFIGFAKVTVAEFFKPHLALEPMIVFDFQGDLCINFEILFTRLCEIRLIFRFDSLRLTAKAVQSLNDGVILQTVAVI